MIRLKKTSKIISLILAFCVAFSSLCVAWAAPVNSIYTGKSYTQNSRFDNFTISNGIDVSEHNGIIDWNAVKASGTDFAFIRVGYTGYGEKGTKVYDKYYKENITGALNAGIEVGVYWFSQAISCTEAADEAQKVLSVIGDYNITLPVVFDYEFGGGGASGRLYKRRNSLGKEYMTQIANKFCERVEQAGYRGCVYASENFFKDYLIAENISNKYEIWLANYATKTSYAGEYNYWQYSSAGKVSGIEGSVDANFRYLPNYAENDINSYSLESIPAQVYSPNGVQPEIKLTKNGAALVQGTDYIVSYSNNFAPGVAEAIITGINAFTGSRRVKFRIAPKAEYAPVKIEGGEGALELTWESAYGASAYWVRYVNNSTGEAGGMTVSENYATVYNLAGLTDYTVSVKPFININGLKIFGEYSPEAVVKTDLYKITGFKQSGATTSSITLSWTAQNGADGYKVYRYNSKTKKYSLVKLLEGASQTTATLNKLNAGSYYYYTVESYCAENGLIASSPKTDVLKVSTKSKTPSIKKPKSTAKRKIKVSWKKVKATGYQIQWSTSKNFSSNTKSVWVKKGSATSKTIKTAKSKKTYYVRVRAYRQPDGKKVYSSWSKTMKIKVR